MCKINDIMKFMIIDYGFNAKHYNDLKIVFKEKKKKKKKKLIIN